MTALLRRFGPTLVMLAVAVASFWALSALDVELFGEKSGPGHTPDLYMENFVSTAMDPTGRPLRRMEAEYMAHFPDTDTHEFQRPYMIMYREEGEPWHVRSERGWVSASGDVMLLLGKVHIWRNNASGLKELDIKTEDLRVLPEKEYGETDKPVLITTPGTETRGVGMKAHLAESRLELLSNVKTRHVPTGVRTPLPSGRALLALLLAAWLASPGAAWALASDREQPIEIEADSAEADEAKGITIYRGDVIITQGTLRISGDQVTIHYDSSNDFEKMITLGTPARFRQLPDGKADEEGNYQRARASRMEYYKQKDTIVLLGNAIYGEGGDQVAADRIDYDSKNGRMKARTMTASKKAESGSGAPKKKSRVRITIQPKKKAN